LIFGTYTDHDHSSLGIESRGNRLGLKLRFAKDNNAVGLTSVLDRR